MDYGVLTYDVPSNEKGAYAKIRKAINGISIRINLSVYLIQWAQQDKIELTLRGISHNVSAQLLKFDPLSAPQAEEIGRKCLKEQSERLLRDLHKIITAEEKNIRKLKKGETKLAELHSAALVFGFTQDVDQILITCKHLLKAALSPSERNQTELPLFPTNFNEYSKEESDDPMEMAA